MSKYRVTLSAQAFVTSTVVVEVEDGDENDETLIEDLAYTEAWNGNVSWDYDGVVDDTITVGSIRRTWSE